jgi:hypothetical protein
MDGDATAAEAAAWQEQQAADNAYLSDIEAEIEAAKNGGSEPEGYFAGSSADDVQARRFARGQYSDSDYAPDPLEEYYGVPPDQIQNVEQLQGYLEHQDQLGRERHDDWDECTSFAKDELLQTLTEAEWRELLLDPQGPERIYQYAKGRLQQHTSRVPTAAQIDRMTPEEWSARLWEYHDSNRKRSEEDDAPQRLTRRDMRKVNKLSPAEFSRFLDLWKAEGN